jgi:acyl-CoA hydrolase/ABC-type branched-subunit amino acid transport system substrate-binding protein
MKDNNMLKSKLISIPEAVGLVQSHHNVGTAMAASEPVGLLTELGKHKDRLEDVRVWVCLPLRLYDFVLKSEMAGHFFVENWFYGAPDRKVHPEGRTSYIPNNLHAAAKVRLEAAGNHLDVFWGTATPPDDRGYMSLSTCLVIEKMLIEAADLVVLEINENLPLTLGDTQIHVSDVDYLVENHVSMFELPSAPPSDWEEAIGGYIAELIEDGSTLQLGIGGIPNAITKFLLERRDLGIHTEMFTDGMVDLYEAGVITGRRKTLWKEKMVGAFALGSQKLYDFVDKNLGVEFQQGKVTNDPYVIAQNYKMISVNTALQVDINGQVCSQSIGSRHYSGTGGQLDTHRGAQMSPGGRGIIALRSTAKGGEISTIVPTLTEGAEVTIPGQDVDTVVTEYGTARLRGLSVKDRMKALIKIAHPDFRSWIEDEAARLKIVPHLSVPGFTPPTRKTWATAPGVSADTIRLGTITDLSGPQANIGLAALRGITAYYDHVNHWGGVHNRKIDLLVEDHAFVPERAEIAAKKLISQEGVFAIVSPLGTAPNLAMMDVLLEAGIPVISPHSGISLWGNPPKHTYFALQPSYALEGTILAQFVVDTYPDVEIGLLVVDDQYGQEGAATFITELNKNGREPAVIQEHSFRDCDPDAWVKTFSSAGVDLVVIYSYVKPAADLLRAAHSAGYNPQWLGSYVISGPDLLELSGAAAAEGLLVTSYPIGPRSHRGERLFLKQMGRLYPGEIPGSHSRIGYAAAQLVVEGLDLAGAELTREGFIEALENLHNWTGGLLPPISYTPKDHRGLTGLALQRAIHGRWILEKSLLKLKE